MRSDSVVAMVLQSFQLRTLRDPRYADFHVLRTTKCSCARQRHEHRRTPLDDCEAGAPGVPQEEVRQRQHLEALADGSLPVMQRGSNVRPDDGAEFASRRLPVQQ